MRWLVRPVRQHRAAAQCDGLCGSTVRWLVRQHRAVACAVARLAAPLEALVVGTEAASVAAG